MERRDRYAIGQQDFRLLRENGCVYVDKTRYIADMISSKIQYYFLARPRRFGKSLFLSTLQNFFEGRRELFNGLYISSTDWEWKHYPVLRLDLNTDRYADTDQLEVVLDSLFNKWERLYEVDKIYPSLSQRFKTIIETAHEKTGLPVVILIDEYDKPLVTNLNYDNRFEFHPGLAHEI